MAAHRERARRAQVEADRLAHEEYTRRCLVEHRDRWEGWLREHLPTNARPSATTITELYDALLADHMIDHPLAQRCLYCQR